MQNSLPQTALKVSSASERTHQESFANAKGPINPSKQSNLEIKKQISESHYKQNIANRPYREKADWQFSKTEYQKWANELGDSKGRFHVDLFTDGKGPVAGNAQEPVFFSARDDAFKHYWGGKFCWGNPVFEAEFIRRMLEKAEEDFQSDPENTRFCSIVPYYRTASWWALTAPYEIKHVYSKDALIYSAPRSQCYSPDKLKDAGEQGGEDRVFIQGAGFESVVLYRDKFSPIRVDPYALAHLRLGHYSAEYIQRLLELGVDLGLPLSSTVLSKSKLSCSCIPCRLAKARRPTFSKTARCRLAGLSPFEKVVFDFTGPIAPTAARDGLKHVLCFTCRKTNYSKVYFCESRSEFMIKFKEFLTWVKTRGWQVKEVKCDQAREFVDKLVEQMCVEEQIVHNFSAAYSHEQNAVAERKFQVLGDVARSLLLTSGLDAYYWPFAYEHACLLSNVMPTRCHDDSSFSPPHFKLYGKHFDYKKLRVWGCKAYPFIGTKVKKLENRCLDGFRFVGIDSKSGAFVLLDPDTGDFMLSGMPTFHENLTEYGKIMSDHRIASRNDFFESEVTENPGIQEQLEVPIKGQRIISHRAFVNPKDKKTREIRAIIHVNCTDSVDRWLYLDEFLQSGTSVSIRKGHCLRVG